MTETLTIKIAETTAARLRRDAAEVGERVEDYAGRLLQEVAADADGDDEELQRRIDAWESSRASIPSAEVHAWARSLCTDSPLPRPKARRPE